MYDRLGTIPRVSRHNRMCRNIMLKTIWKAEQTQCDTSSANKHRSRLSLRAGRRRKRRRRGKERDEEEEGEEGCKKEKDEEKKKRK